VNKYKLEFSKIKLIFFFDKINHEINREKFHDEEFEEIIIDSNMKYKFKDDINKLKIKINVISKNI